MQELVGEDGLNMMEVACNGVCVTVIGEENL